MKRTVIAIAIFSLFTFHFSLAYAQDFAPVLKAVEEGSPTLWALRLKAGAATAEARSQLAPQDPQVEAAYLWGTPDNRFDLNVTQSFDFPTDYLYRHRLAEAAGGVAEADYRAARATLEARQALFDASAESHRAQARALYDRVASLAALVADYQAAVAPLLDLSLLAVAYEQGQLTLTEYLLEQQAYLDARRRRLDAQRAGVAHFI